MVKIEVRTFYDQVYQIDVDSYDPSTVKAQLDDPNTKGIVFGPHVFSPLDIRHVGPVDDGEAGGEEGGATGV